MLTGFGRMSLVSASPSGCRSPAPVVELDVQNQEHLDTLADRVREHVDGLDGVVHSIGFAPASCLGAPFMDAPWEDVADGDARLRVLVQVAGEGRAAAARRTVRRSSASTSTPVRRGPPTTGWAWRRRRWSRSTATWRASSARDGIRVNLVAAGPVRTMAAKSIPGFAELEKMWGERAPLGWDVDDATPVAKSVCGLLSDWFPATTGSMVFVDGGVHFLGL